MKKLLLIAFLTGIMFAGTTQAAIVFDWQFDDKLPGESSTAGERVIDSSGNGRDLYAGTDSDMPEFWSGDLRFGEGSAINLSTGSDELVFEAGHDFGDGGAVAGSAIVIGGTDSFTIEAVIKLSQTNLTSGNHHALIQVPAEGGKEMFIRIWGGNRTDGRDGYLEWVFDDGPHRVSFTAPINMHDAKWHHVAFVRDCDENMAYIYVDHELLASKYDGVTEDISTATQNWYVGSFYNSSTREFKGSIDFIRMYDEAMGPAGFTQKIARVNYDPNTLDGAVDIDPELVELIWELTDEPNVTVSGQSVELASDAEFTDIINSFSLSNTETHVYVNSLDYGKRYYWRVNVDGARDSDPFSNKGLTWWFQTKSIDEVVAGYWKFDNGILGEAVIPGEMMVDSSANNRHMVAIQRDGHPAGSYDTACASYGSGAAFQTPAGTFAQLETGYDFGDGNIAGTPPVMSKANGNLTIEAVVKANTRDDGGHGVVFSYQPSVEDDFWYGYDKSPATYFRVNNDGKVRFTFSNWTASRTVTSSMDVRDAWHHIAGVRDTTSGTLSIYIDGVLEVQDVDSTVDGQDFVPSGLAAIGNFFANTSQTRTFDGKIDFVKITNAALTPEEFVLPIELPSVPDPLDGATAVPTSYTLSWNPIADAIITSETVVLASDPYMTNVIDTIPAVNSSVEVVDLAVETVYYWRVDTVGSDDNGSFSREGTVWSFRTPICVLHTEDGDLDGNCVVDLADFATMAQNWLRSEYE